MAIPGLASGFITFGFIIFGRFGGKNVAIPGLAGGFIIFGCFGGKNHGDSWFSWWFHHLWSFWMEKSWRFLV